MPIAFTGRRVGGMYGQNSPYAGKKKNTGNPDDAPTPADNPDGGDDVPGEEDDDEQDAARKKGKKGSKSALAEYSRQKLTLMRRGLTQAEANRHLKATNRPLFEQAIAQANRRRDPEQTLEFLRGA